MTNPDELNALADRCEREEASRELDAFIERAINPEKIVLFDGGSVRHPRCDAVRGKLADFPLNADWSDWAGVALHVGAPSYTTSLDAAVTLVPEGAEWDLTTLYGVARVAVGLNLNEGPHYASHEGGLLPMAICAASLRARAALAGDATGSGR